MPDDAFVQDNLFGNAENTPVREQRGSHPQIALYREWRPRTFKEVVEQEHVVKTLINSVARNRLAHAYLFCGTRGTGKTTLAQILSRAVNCLNPVDSEPCNKCEMCEGIISGRILDVAEIDAASNNSVDNVRALRDQINYAPAQAKYKVYIIDEVHMLSGGAFNALLKTLEEPPSYVIFILATTEPHKLPATVLSRCQRFDFKRITDGAVAERLALIAGFTGTAADPDALRLIARLSEGSLRDAISIFDQCASAPHGDALSLNDVLRITGRPEDDNLVQCASILINRDVKAIPGHVAAISASGVNYAQYIDGMTVLFRNMLMMKLGHERGAFPEMHDGVYAETRSLASCCDVDYLLAVASEFSVMAYSLKNSINQTVLLEVSLAKICLGRFLSNNAVENLNARIAALEIWRDNFKAHAYAPSANMQGDGAYAPAAAINIPGDGAYTPAATPVIPDEPLIPNEPLIPIDGSAIPSDEPAIPIDEPVIAADKPAAAGDAGDTADFISGGPDNREVPDIPDGPDTPAQTDAIPVPSPVDSAIWNGIVARFLRNGNPRLYSILDGAAAQTLGDNFQIILPPDKVSLSGLLINPANISKLRDEIESATGKAYSVQIVSERGALADLAKKINEKFDIPTSIYP